MVMSGCRCQFIEFDLDNNAFRCHKDAKKRCEFQNKLGVRKEFLVCNYHIGPLMNKAANSKTKIIKVRLAL